MLIRDFELDVDILEEIEQFDWVGEVIKGNKFISCSPFRSERHPSFAVNLDDGLWIDSGNSDEYYHKGNLVKLLSLLRNEDINIIEDYLIEKYATILADTEVLELHLNLYGEQSKPKYIDRASIRHLYKYCTDYLTKRGISSEIQQLFGIGFNPENNTVAMPWHDKQGNIINIKYRRIAEKAFFYEKGGQPIKNYVYGIYQCILKKAKRVFICESEIDALTLWTYGYPAIAVGGSSLSDSQKQLILSAGIEELVIATDNDLVGKRFKDFLAHEFGGNLTIYMFIFPDGVKDINDMTEKQIKEAIEKLQILTFNFLNLSV
ncbi:TPA: toprim domain-containing protein [Clostridium botulinum]|uniref:toprim domain-containing protein n=1 Tax=Clostridium botulinum TaxID=1491 RepID=UPI001C9B75AA|nr:toprim domain-containing protein [Clostridium botulinum]MBY6909567.1 toprim domain-containing protein [Clostridium botulinum]